MDPFSFTLLRQSTLEKIAHFFFFFVCVCKADQFRFEAGGGGSLLTIVSDAKITMGRGVSCVRRRRRYLHRDCLHRRKVSVRLVKSWWRHALLLSKQAVAGSVKITDACLR